MTKVKKKNYSLLITDYLLLLLGLNLLLSTSTFAQLAAEPLRVDPTAIVKNGTIQSTSILTDDFGQVFIEIPERVYIAHANDQTGFTGEIMPPKKITIPDQTPKTRQREVFSFELVADSGADLVFSDKVHLLPERQRLRLATLNDGKPLEGAPKPKLIYILEDEMVRQPKLWRYIDAETGWQRVGGLLKERDETRRIFSVYINQTGKYSIIDEAPQPAEISPEMLTDTSYESIESIEARIAELETIRAEIIARDQGILFSNESGYTPDFLLDPDFDINSMTDEEFFSAFFADEDLNFLEADETDGTVVDPDPWEEAFLIPSLESPTTDDVGAAEFLVTGDQPLPAIDPATGQPIVPAAGADFLSSENSIPAPEFASPAESVMPDQVPTTPNVPLDDLSVESAAMLPQTGESGTLIQKIWDGFKGLFIGLVLLVLPGYLVWERLQKNDADV